MEGDGKEGDIHGIGRNRGAREENWLSIADQTLESNIKDSNISFQLRDEF